MNKTYILIPVEKHSINASDKQDLLSRAQDLSRKGKRKNNVKIIWADDANADKMLQSLKSEDRLYISAHGNHEYIGTQGSTVELSPKQLADLLQTKGVPKSFTDIRVFACHSAEDVNPDEEGMEEYFVPPEAQLRQQTYAGKFATELENIGYKNAIVRGYMGAIHYIKSRKGTEGPYLARELKGYEGQRAEFFIGDDSLKLRPSQGSFRFRNSESDESTLDAHTIKNKENFERRVPPENGQSNKKKKHKPS